MLGRSRVLLAVSLALVTSGCTCRARVTGAGDNLSDTGAGKELHDVHFAFDSYALDGTAKSILERNANWLKDHGNVNVEVQGHCDERGTNEYNMALGSRRAKAAADYLGKLGVEKNRLRTTSYGEDAPLDPGHNEEAWAKNRRAHFNVQ